MSCIDWAIWKQSDSHSLGLHGLGHGRTRGWSHAGAAGPEWACWGLACISRDADVTNSRSSPQSCPCCPGNPHSLGISGSQERLVWFSWECHKQISILLGYNINSMESLLLEQVWVSVFFPECLFFYVVWTHLQWLSYILTRTGREWKSYKDRERNTWEANSNLQFNLCVFLLKI